MHSSSSTPLASIYVMIPPLRVCSYHVLITLPKRERTRPCRVSSERAVLVLQHVRINLLNSLRSSHVPSASNFSFQRTRYHRVALSLLEIISSFRILSIFSVVLGLISESEGSGVSQEMAQGGLINQ